jgi:hypothetical protein
MKARIKTKDSKFWITDGGCGISEDKCDATIFPTILTAKAYIKGTNVFGDLQICKIEKNLEN